MRPSIRFEVFKRDAFTCQYCGAKAPTVVLEVDHIVPRAEGGSDEIENLVTACWDCNRGKGATQLSDHAPVPDIEERTMLIREREEQLRALHAAEEERLARRHNGFAACWNYWIDIWGGGLQTWETPWEGALRRHVDELGVAAVQEAMYLAFSRCRTPYQATKYYGGIMRKKLADREPS